MSLHTRFCKVCGVDIDISSDKYLYILEGILVEEFTSAKEAHIKYGFSQCRIGLCCNGKINSVKNFIWKYEHLL